MANTVRPGKIVKLQELQHPSSPFRTPFAPLRVMGKLVNYDVTNGIALIEHEGCQLQVDTKFLREVHFREGSLYQFIGELKLGSENEMELQASVARNVDGLDTNLYYKALDLRRQFLNDSFHGL